MPSVWPSGAALAVALTPMLPPAPGRFSMMTVPSEPLTASARMRAVTAIGPPAPKGTMMRVVPAWASPRAGVDRAAAAPRALMNWRRSIMRVSLVGGLLFVQRAGEGIGKERLFGQPGLGDVVVPCRFDHDGGAAGVHLVAREVGVVLQHRQVNEAGAAGPAVFGQG